MQGTSAQCPREERFQNAVAESRRLGAGARSSVCVVLPPVGAHRDLSGCAGCAGLAGRTAHAGTTVTGSPLLRLLGEPAADLRRSAHPHVVFRLLVLVLCDSRFASAVLLMKWNPGTNGPRAQGARSPREQKSSHACVSACGSPSTHRAARASCRATSRPCRAHHCSVLALQYSH